MYRFWEKGISPREFRKVQLRDIYTVLAIDNMLQEKQQAEHKLRQAISKLKW